MKNKLPILLLIGLVIFCYINSLGNNFVSDDRGILINAPSWDLSSVFSRPYTFIRPLLYLITYKVAGFSPVFFRLPNILFHMGAVLLIYVIIKNLANGRVALLSSSLFAVHPLMVESITWISGGVYVQYSFFFLLSFFFYLRSRKSKKNYIFSLLAYTCALISSEKAITLALTFFVYEFCFGDLKKHWIKASPYFILSSIWVMLHFLRFAERVSYFEDQALDLTPYNPFFQVPIAITSYIQLLIWPSDLTIYHSEMIFSQVEYAIRVVGFLGFLVFVGYCLWRNRFLFFWFCFFVIALLPTINPFVLGWIVAERYVYIAIIGIMVPIAYVVEKSFSFPKIKVATMSFFVIVIALFSIRTIVRNIDWATEDNLWLAAAKTSPSSAQNHNNLGDYYGRHGDYANSILEFKRAITLKQNYADAYHNLGNAYRDSGQTDLGIQSYEKAYSFNPKLWQSYQNIAAIYYMQGKYKDAQTYLQKGLTANPNNTNLLVVLSLVYVKSGERDKAREVLLNALSIDPNSKLIKQALSQLQNNTLQ